MATQQNPPPKVSDVRFWEWLFQFWKRTEGLVSASGTISGTNTGDVTVTDTGTINLTITGQVLSADIIGLTAANITDLTDAGDSTLHFHATDRDLANATGVLVISKISPDVLAFAAAN